MKNIFSMMMLAICLLAVQACGPKKSSDAAEASVVQKELALTPAERKEKFEKQRAERSERRRMEYEKLIASSPTYTDANGILIYNKAESEPVYTGGNDAMMTYLKDNLVYPQDAIDNQEEGLVFVDFVIDKDGKVRDVEVTEATNEDVNVSFRSEAARVVSAMPKWTPGRHQGKAVDVKYSVPISFQIM